MARDVLGGGLPPASPLMRMVDAVLWGDRGIGFQPVISADKLKPHATPDRLEAYPTGDDRLETYPTGDDRLEAYPTDFRDVVLGDFAEEAEEAAEEPDGAESDGDTRPPPAPSSGAAWREGW